MKKIQNLMIVLTVFGLLTGATFAQKGYLGGPGGIKSGKGMYYRLNLTEDQQKKFDEMNFAREKERIEIRNQMEMNRLELSKLSAEENLDESAFRKLTEKQSELHAKMQKVNTEFWLDANKILDKDQKVIWKNNFRGRMHGFDGKPGFGAGRGFNNGKSFGHGRGGRGYYYPDCPRFGYDRPDQNDN